MLGHEPLPRNDIERLGDVLADLGELAVAAARAARRGWVNDAPARQIGGKVAPRRLTPREALHLDVLRLRLRLFLALGRSQLLELQLQLINEPLTALGARTEHLALHLFDHQLLVLDHRLRARELGARLNQCCLQRSDLFGKMIGALDHARDTAQSH